MLFRGLRLILYRKPTTSIPTRPFFSANTFLSRQLCVLAAGMIQKFRFLVGDVREHGANFRFHIFHDTAGFLRLKRDAYKVRRSRILLLTATVFAGNIFFDVRGGVASILGTSYVHVMFTSPVSQQ